MLFFGMLKLNQNVQIFFGLLKLVFGMLRFFSDCEGFKTDLLDLNTTDNAKQIEIQSIKPTRKAQTQAFTQKTKKKKILGPGSYMIRSGSGLTIEF